MRSTTELSITVKDSSTGFYITDDLIQGHVSLEFEKDTNIDELSITLEGKTATRIEKHVILSNIPGYISGEHTFLRMSCPIRLTDLPKQCLARRRQTYHIPFNFTVPQSLLPYACSHATIDESTTRKAHLHLPPSLGSPESGDIFIDDIDSNRAKIAYTINFRLRKHFSDGRSVLLQKAMPVCIIPTTAEEPPMFIAEDDPYYRLSHSKGVCKGLSPIGKAVGRLEAHAKEPASLTYRHQSEDADGCQTSSIAVDLHFRPTRSGQVPPRLHSVKTKLHSFTFFGALPYQEIPRPGDVGHGLAEHCQYMSTIGLGTLKTGFVKWTKQESLAAEDLELDPSPASITDDRSPDYTTTLQIPIRLPKSTCKQSGQRLLTPSFQSCLVSRVYSLELNLSYKATPMSPGGAPDDSAVSKSVAGYLTTPSHLILRLPLQVNFEIETVHSSTATVLQCDRLCDWGRDQSDECSEALPAAELPPPYTPLCRQR